MEILVAIIIAAVAFMCGTQMYKSSQGMKDAVGYIPTACMVVGIVSFIVGFMAYYQNPYEVWTSDPLGIKPHVDPVMAGAAWMVTAAAITAIGNFVGILWAKQKLLKQTT